ncbi:MAG: hypothetical protein WCJ71_05430 [Candidatus Omnitrophota bacterium]
MKKLISALLVMVMFVGAFATTALAGKQCQCKPCKCNPPCECAKK